MTRPTQAHAAARGLAGAGADASVGPGMWALSTVLLLSVASDLFMANGVTARVWTAAAGSATLAVLFALLAVRQRHRPWGPAAAPHVVGAVAVLCAADAVLHVAMGGDPVYLMLTLMGAGTLVPSFVWLLMVDAACLGGYVVACWGRWDDPQWFGGAVTLGIVLAFTHAIHLMQQRSRARLAAVTAVLETAASTDALTGLLNRRGLLAAAAGRWMATRPRTGGQVLGALWLDVNGFKKINDQLGHAAGDAVLVEIGDRLRGLLPSAVLARIGGDEFVVLVEVASHDALEQLGHRLRMRLRGTAGPLELNWSVSIGTATRPLDHLAAPEDLDAVLRTADFAMYDDKQARYAAAEPTRDAGRPVAG